MVVCDERNCTASVSDATAFHRAERRGRQRHRRADRRPSERERMSQTPYKFNFTTPSCCSFAQGALVGTSVAASLGWTSLLSIKYRSTSSPLMSASMCPLISIQGESGCPLLVSISQRKAGFWMMSFSVYGRLYLARTARTPALQPQ